MLDSGTSKRFNFINSKVDKWVQLSGLPTFGALFSKTPAGLRAGLAPPQVQPAFLPVFGMASDSYFSGFAALFEAAFEGHPSQVCSWTLFPLRVQPRFSAFFVELCFRIAPVIHALRLSTAIRVGRALSIVRFGNVVPGLAI